MRIVSAQRVTRYKVRFSPTEARMLSLHATWGPRIPIRHTASDNVYAEAELTKHEINQVCDALGVNGRDFASRLARLELGLTP